MPYSGKMEVLNARGAVMSEADDFLAQQREHEQRASAATALAAHAFDRLLARAASDTGQSRRVASFIATIVGRSTFDIYDLRAMDVEISDDILLCIDAIRWAKLHLPHTVPDGLEKAEAVCREWGYV